MPMPWDDVRQHLFNEEKINQKAPEKSGVYFLYKNGKLTYIGGSDGTRTSNMRTRLLRHFNGKEGKCTESADTFGVLPDKKGKLLESKLRKIYLKLNKKYPKCNDRP